MFSHTDIASVPEKSAKPLRHIPRSVIKHVNGVGAGDLHPLPHHQRPTAAHSEARRDEKNEEGTAEVRLLPRKAWPAGVTTLGRTLLFARSQGTVSKPSVAA